MHEIYTGIVDNVWNIDHFNQSFGILTVIDVVALACAEFVI